MCTTVSCCQTDLCPGIKIHVQSLCTVWIGNRNYCMCSWMMVMASQSTTMYRANLARLCSHLPLCLIYDARFCAKTTNFVELNNSNRKDSLALAMFPKKEREKGKQTDSEVKKTFLLFDI